MQQHLLNFEQTPILDGIVPTNLFSASCSSPVTQGQRIVSKLLLAYFNFLTRNSLSEFDIKAISFGIVPTIRLLPLVLYRQVKFHNCTINTKRFFGIIVPPAFIVITQPQSVKSPIISVGAIEKCSKNIALNLLFNRVDTKISIIDQPI